MVVKMCKRVMTEGSPHEILAEYGPVTETVGDAKPIGATF